MFLHDTVRPQVIKQQFMGAGFICWFGGPDFWEKLEKFQGNFETMFKFNPSTEEKKLK